MPISNETLSHNYCITIEREHDPSIRDTITFLLILNGRPRPLADGGSIAFQTSEKHFEVPVFITNNSKTRFEGVLTGIADGEDICIKWKAERGCKTLGHITATTNNTVTFLERKGAAG